MRNSRRSYRLRSVENALLLLEAISHAEGDLGIKELSLKLHLAPSTIHRLLATLQARDFVEQDGETRKYRLGIRTFEVGSKAIGRLSLREVARPHLERLVNEAGETASLGILDQGEVLYIGRVESRSLIQISTRIGGRAPAHCTAMGKALLAFQPAPLIAEVLRKPLQAYTPHTITDPQVLAQELSKVRERGFAYSKGELDEAVSSVGAPIWNRRGEVVAAVGLAGLTSQFPENQLSRLVEPLCHQTQEISVRLGYHPSALAATA